MKILLNRVLRVLGIQLIKTSSYEILKERSKIFDRYALVDLQEESARPKITSLLDRSRSQIQQDLFVISAANFKHDGYFIEFGATDGVRLSNTYLLEKEFGWKGILAEPARIWHQDLRKNRTAKIETRCVWKESDAVLLFNEVVDNEHQGELSTIEAYSNSDDHAKTRAKDSSVYPVETISLTDLLKENNAPRNIDYLSIDTEGSEYEILNAFDFEAYNIKIITCEHNFTDNRAKIHRLLVSKGYERKFTELSKFDDWYIKTL